METYRGMDRDALAEAYNNRAVVPGWQDYMTEWETRSAALYAGKVCTRDLSYDESSPRRRFDVFEGDRPNLPTVLYMHGGYWQWNDKEGQAFVAEGALGQGISVAVGEHTLAPAITMSGMAEEMRQLVRAVSAHAFSAGRSPRVVVLGMSSGAHLLALTLNMEDVAGALLISGAYDLDPVRLSPLNDAIGMDHAEARTCSPLHLPHRAPKPVTVAFGDAERPEIRRQGEDFQALLIGHGYPARLLPVPDTDHFSVLETLAHPDGTLCRALVTLVEECAGP